MLKKLEYICLIGAVGLIGADRIDLFGGYGFFRLSPFLFFALSVLLFRFLFAGLGGGFRIAIGPPLRRQTAFLVVLALLLLISFTSTIFGMDPERGLVALCGLVLVSVLGYCVSVRILEDPDPQKLVVHSVSFALIAWLIFCVGECIAFEYGFSRAQEEASSSIASIFAPTSTLLWAPRLLVFCLDANRAGFILVMYLFLLDRFADKTRYTRFLRFSIGFFLLLTVSRSAMLCWFAYCIFSRGFWKRLASRRVALAVASLCDCLFARRSGVPRGNH